MEHPIELPQILQALMQHLEQGDSGTFLIATTENASCRIALETGKLTHCVYQRQHGHAAIAALLLIHSGRFSFSAAQLPFRPQDKLDHKQAIQQIQPSLMSTPPVHATASSTGPDIPEITSPTLKTRIYRGQVMKIPEDAAEETAPAPTSSKPRYYRGQQIMD